MSTTNHNILYFAYIPRTWFLNIAIQLWKAQNSLAQCGFPGDNFASSPVQQRGLHAVSRPIQIPVQFQSSPIQKPSPRHSLIQDVKRCKLPNFHVEKWTTAHLFR
jgi:hypothetical protein